VQRAESHWPDLQGAASANGTDANLLAGIGLRETDFLNIPERGGGMGRGVFQIDIGKNKRVTEAQANNPGFAANFAANMLHSNKGDLASAHPNFNAGQLTQATAASYNMGLGKGGKNFSGNPATIDVGTKNGNYGSNVLAILNSCLP
jgi:hypothetical protein